MKSGEGVAKGTSRNAATKSIPLIGRHFGFIRVSRLQSNSGTPALPLVILLLLEKRERCEMSSAGSRNWAWLRNSCSAGWSCAVLFVPDSGPLCIRKCWISWATDCGELRVWDVGYQGHHKSIVRFGQQVRICTTLARPCLAPRGGSVRHVTAAARHDAP